MRAAAVLLLSLMSTAAFACDSTDLEENVKWCTSNAHPAVKAAFCRELGNNNTDGAFGSLNNCLEHLDRDKRVKIMNNANACGGGPTVLNMVRKYRSNLSC